MKEVLGTPGESVGFPWESLGNPRFYQGYFCLFVLKHVFVLFFVVVVLTYYFLVFV